MGTFTAQILIGSSHLYHGGINPGYVQFLSENSRPAWILNPIDQPKDKLIWIPTVESMLEDALLMIAFYVVKDPEIVNDLQNYESRLLNRESFYDVLPPELLNNLHRCCQTLSNYPKLIISVFSGSTILSQLSNLKKYQMEVEVCTPNYTKLSSIWSTK